MVYRSVTNIHYLNATLLKCLKNRFPFKHNHTNIECFIAYHSDKSLELTSLSSSSVSFIDNTQIMLIIVRLNILNQTSNAFSLNHTLL